MFSGVPSGSHRTTGPSGSSSSSRSVSFDYSGLDDALKKQDELAQTSHSKYQQLYSGDVAGSVSSSQRIRDLLAQLSAHAPGVSEKSPYQISSPLSRVSSVSTSSSSDFDTGAAQSEPGDLPALPMPEDGRPQKDPNAEALEKLRQQKAKEEAEAAKRDALRPNE
jgi:hypothetical protein